MGFNNILIKCLSLHFSLLFPPSSSMAPKPIMVFLLELNSTPLPKASGEKENQSDKTQSTLKKLQIKIKTMDSKGMLLEVSHLTSINRNYTDMERPITEL